MLNWLIVFKENKSLGIPDEYKLRSDLFDEYLKEARPVRKRTDVTNVTISLSKIQLVDLVTYRAVY